MTVVEVLLFTNCLLTAMVVFGQAADGNRVVAALKVTAMWLERADKRP